jgi:HlyD family type I secretion membrane fusion protein
MQNAAQELKENSARLYDLEQQLRPSEEAAVKLSIVAPQPGRIFNIRVTTIGEVINAGTILAEIVPDNAERIVEILVPVRDIKNVHVGSAGDVRFSAYNARTTPEIDATVTYVAPDRTVDRENPMLAGYLVRLKLDPASLKQADDLEVVPGMSVTVFIRAGERTMMSYLFQPVLDSFRKAFRETY